jgi:hypothetical protein
VHSVIQTHDGGFGILSRDFYVWIIKTDIDGIPEFPSWIMLPLFLVATLFAVVFKKRLTHVRRYSA